MELKGQLLALKCINNNVEYFGDGNHSVVLHFSMYVLSPQYSFNSIDYNKKITVFATIMAKKIRVHQGNVLVPGTYQEWIKNIDKYY